MPGQFCDGPDANYGKPVEITKSVLEAETKPVMRGYDLLKQYQKLTPYQQDQCIQWFTGGVGMAADGFRDGHRDQLAARYALDQFEIAIQYGAKQQALAGKVPEGMLTPGFIEHVTDPTIIPVMKFEHFGLTEGEFPEICLEIVVTETTENSGSVVERCETCLL